MLLGGWLLNDVRWVREGLLSQHYVRGLNSWLLLSHCLVLLKCVYRRMHNPGIDLAIAAKVLGRVQV